MRAELLTIQHIARTFFRRRNIHPHLLRDWEVGDLATRISGGG